MNKNLLALLHQRKGPLTDELARVDAGFGLGRFPNA